MRSVLAQLASVEVVRFFTVALIGLVIDISVGSVLIIGFAMADIPAAAIGLFAGMVSNYFMHLKWTFAASERRASTSHFLVFSAGVIATLAVRSAVLWGIEAAGWQSVLPPPVRLGIGAALAFALSYYISRNLVFQPKPNVPPNDGS